MTFPKLPIFEHNDPSKARKLQRNKRNQEKTCPLAKITGSVMMRPEMGHRNCGGTGTDKRSNLLEKEALDFKSLRTESAVMASSAACRVKSSPSTIVLTSSRNLPFNANVRSWLFDIAEREFVATGSMDGV